MDTYSPLTPPSKWQEFLTDAQNSVRNSLEQGEAIVRERPKQAVAVAFAVGSIAGRLPIPTLLRLAWMVAPSTLAVVGAGALMEYCRRKDAAYIAARAERLRREALYLESTVPSNVSGL